MLFRRLCPGCRAPSGRSVACPACEAALRRIEPIELVPPPALDRVVALHRYDRTIRPMLLAAKNGGRRSLLRRWGRELAPLAEPALPNGAADVVTWVPASRQGRRARGYDQGRLLAASTAAAAAGPPARRLLVRRPGPIRVGADRADRLGGPGLRCPVVSPRRVLLVDDVFTTGASLAAAAAALRAAGASAVVGLVVAVAGADPPIRAFDPDDRRAARH